LRPISMRRVMRNAAGSITRMNSQEPTVRGMRTRLRDTRRVRLSSSGYRPNSQSHAKPSPVPLRTSA
jgi:hypothetical protein